jgi:Holliday junction resolvasome RuvABC endonuclease subunit
MLLALDISASRTGWCVFALDAPLPSLGPSPKPPCGTKRFLHHRDIDGDFGVVYLRFTEWLSDIIQVHGITYVAFEAPLMYLNRGKSNINSARLLIGLACHAESCARANGIPGPNVLELDVTSLKKFATNRGHADKSEMVNAARRNWGPDITDHNIADALHLGSYALHRIRYWATLRSASA